jgi:hypothetical protein
MVEGDMVEGRPSAEEVAVAQYSLVVVEVARYQLAGVEVAQYL